MARRKRRRLTAAVAIERRGDVQRETSGGAAQGRLNPAVHRLGLEHEPGVQAGTCAAALVDAAEGVVRLVQPHRHALDLAAKPAHLEEHAVAHLTPEGLREDETRARDGDLQSPSGGMVPELPSWLLAV